MRSSHQKQALTFMLRREQGWAYDMSEEDIWSKVIGVDGRIASVTLSLYEKPC
jgi:hypothetical protein